MTQTNFVAAIIGYGTIGHTHAKGYLADSRVRRLALADPQTRPEELSERVAGYSNAVEMLETERPEVVSICVPHHLHLPVALEVARYGVGRGGSVRYVLLEKPMALNEKEALEIEAAFKAVDIRLMLAHSLRFSSPFRRMAELLKAESAPLGQPRLLLGNYLMYKDYSLYPAWKRQADQAGGGVLLRDGLHVLDAILNVAGSEPVEVWGQAALLSNEAEVEDTFLGGIRFASGALAQLTYSNVGRADNQIALTVHTPVATLKANLEQLQVWSEAVANGVSLPPAAAQPEGVVEPAQGDLWANQMAYFIECVAQNALPEVTGRDGRLAVKVIERLYEAARLGRHLAI
ncbi:MAG TPA: Gfo/Idh/MocA family oxidoreductase [Chloroflexia bacterium]|nr:Gfo/Idh/MocA family oxidoreductase [Chloroflexia bacterium]